MESPIQAHPPQNHSSNHHHHHHTSSNNSSNDALMRPRRVIGKFFLSKTLGKGSMGKVKLALNTETNEKASAFVCNQITKREPNTMYRWLSRLCPVDLHSTNQHHPPRRNEMSKSAEKYAPSEKPASCSCWITPSSLA